MWIRTAELYSGHGDVRVLIIARATATGQHGQFTDVPTDTGGLFTPAWAGYHYEAVGSLLRYRYGGHDVDLTGDPPPGRPPMLRMPEPGTDALLLEAALWWQRAYKPTEDGEEPPLIAELHWRPPLLGARQFLRVQLPGDVVPTTKDFTAAKNARKLLAKTQARLGGGGRHKGDGDRWLSDQEAMADIDRELRDGARSAIALATRLGVDRSAIYRRIWSATHKRFSEYVSSREFTQHEGR